jgi:cilia- and flagella-associated protein 45
MVYPVAYTRLEGSRRGNYQADVDESLFGNTGKTRKTQTNRQQRNGRKPAAGNSSSAVVNPSLLRQLNIAPVETSTVTSSDYARIHALVHPPSVTTTHFPTSAAIARKQRILSTTVADAGVGEGCEDDAAIERVSALGNAKAMLEEEHDEVKRMNQLMLYAQCVTVRDAQVEEKRKRAEESKQQEAYLDHRMEEDRVRKLKAEQVAEEKKERERRLGAATIVLQIEAREKERLREEEAREAEARVMVEAIQRRQREEEERRVEKVERGKAIMAEVTASNFQQTLEKAKRKEKELEEEKKRLRYLQQKEERERQREEEENRIRREKEDEIARLRAQQERAQDRQAVIDEVRARRYQQEKDRQYRDEELRKESERRQRLADIEQVRRSQREDRDDKEEKERQQARNELERIQEVQRRQSAREEEMERKKQEERRQHALQVREQIRRKEEDKARARAEYLKDGRGAEQRLEREKQRLEAIRADKVRALQRMGVPDKYAAELKHKKILSDKIVWDSQAAPKK